MKMFISFFTLCIANAYGHGILTDPRQRGALRLDNHLVPTIDWDAPTDYTGHYPSGSKDNTPGAGTASLRRAAGNYWTPHEPLNPSNRWRCGVCGDELGAPQDHLRRGKFYHDAYRVREYLQGSVIFMEAEIVTHHNGYFEFYVCNIDTCGDDISVRCFHEGHCQQLLRTPGPCDSGYETGCGPIDRMNPGRWYLPCPRQEPYMLGGWSRTIAYTLPPDLVCEHCVIHWYWTAANTCNPPGVREYFTSEYAPNWGYCEGQGGARGGFAANKPECGGHEFPEEYFQCADIRIWPNSNHGHHGHGHPQRPGSSAHMPPPAPAPAPPAAHGPAPAHEPSVPFQGSEPKTAVELHAEHASPSPSPAGSTAFVQGDDHDHDIDDWDGDDSSDSGASGSHAESSDGASSSALGLHHSQV